MERQNLDRLLGELREELADSNQLDEASRESLRQLSEQLDRIAASNEDPGWTVERARDAALRLEASHPRLAQIVGRIGDTLAKIGI